MVVCWKKLWYHTMKMAEQPSFVALASFIDSPLSPWYLNTLSELLPKSHPGLETITIKCHFPFTCSNASWNSASNSVYSGSKARLDSKQLFSFWERDIFSGSWCLQFLWTLTVEYADYKIQTSMSLALTSRVKVCLQQPLTNPSCWTEGKSQTSCQVTNIT